MEGGERASSIKWVALVALATAQFVMVLDQSVMNVSISALVHDFDTTVPTIQAVITLYCLVMAMFMMAGAKIGDMIGRRRAFSIGLVIYGCGSALTAGSQSVAMLAIGWSVLEGLGAALVLPALAALIGGNFAGQSRKIAYAVIGGVAGAGIAVGPILGGWATTELTWRVVFAGEVVFVVFILVMTRFVSDAPQAGAEAAPRRRGDRAVGGRARSGRPRRAAIEHLGLDQAEEPAVRDLRALADACSSSHSAGRCCGDSSRWQRRREATDHDPLVHLDLVKIPTFRSGLFGLFSQNLILMGVFFVDPPLPADRARVRCPQDRREDAARLRDHVRSLCNRLAPLFSLRGPLDRAHRPHRGDRWESSCCSGPSSPAWPMRGSSPAWRCSESAWG